MSSALVQLQNTVRQFRASYESEHATSRRALDWDKFWATAHLQAQQPNKEHTINKQQQVIKEQIVIKEQAQEVYATPAKQQLLHRTQESSRRSMPAEQPTQQQQPQPSPSRSLLAQSPRPQQTPSTAQKRVQFSQVESSERSPEDMAFQSEEVPTDDIIYIDIELDDGTVATVGIAPEEDPETVALEFVRDHQLGDHYVSLLAKYLRQTLSETNNIAVFDDPPEHIIPPLTMSLESVALSWGQKPAIANIRNRHVLTVRLQNNQNFDWNEISGSRQTEMLVFQDTYANNRADSNRGVTEFSLLTPNVSLVLPHGRKPMVSLELWQLNRKDMVAFSAARADPLGMLDILHASGKMLATALFVTNNDEFDGNGSANLQDPAGRVLGALTFIVRRAALGSR